MPRLTLVTIFIFYILPKKSERVGIAAWIDLVEDLVLAAASPGGTAALGTRILTASLGAETVKQGVRESAIAGCVGAAVWLVALPTLTFAIWFVSWALSGGIASVWMALVVGVNGKWCRPCSDRANLKGKAVGSVTTETETDNQMMDNGQ